AEANRVMARVAVSENVGLHLRSAFTPPCSKYVLTNVHGETASSADGVEQSDVRRDSALYPRQDAIDGFPANEVRARPTDGFGDVFVERVVVCAVDVEESSGFVDVDNVEMVDKFVEARKVAPAHRGRFFRDPPHDPVDVVYAQLGGEKSAVEHVID